MPHRRKTRKTTSKSEQSQQSQPARTAPDQNTPRLRDYREIGPTGIEGVEASDLPDHGRGPVETVPGKELRRKPPARTGENSTGDVGIRATPDIAEASDHGHRKRN
jgi:hypothetical protein